MARGNGSSEDRVAALEAQVQELLLRLAERPDPRDDHERLVRVETALGQNPEDLAAMERFKEWAGLDAQAKSQLEADRHFAGDLAAALPRWRVSIWRSPDGTRGHAKARRLREYPELTIRSEERRVGKEGRSRW